MAGSAGAATVAGAEFSVDVPDLFVMSPNPFTIGSSGTRTVAGYKGLPGDPSFTFDFSPSGRLDLSISGNSNLVIGGAEAFLFNLIGEKRPTITGFDLISTDILDFGRDDIGFTDGNLIIVIGGQAGDEPQWQPGHGAAFQISTTVGAELPLPGTLFLLAAQPRMRSLPWVQSRASPLPGCSRPAGRPCRRPRAEDLFKATAARMTAFRAFSFSLSPSWKSMARLTLPSRLELKTPEGSFREAPLTKVIFTTFLYVSPVQISPSCDQTGVPLHFHSSTTSGSAALISARSRASISPLQSSSSAILASMSSDGDSALVDRLFMRPLRDARARGLNAETTAGRCHRREQLLQRKEDDERSCVQEQRLADDPGSKCPEPTKHRHSDHVEGQLVDRERGREPEGRPRGRAERSEPCHGPLRGERPAHGRATDGSAPREGGGRPWIAQHRESHSLIGEPHRGHERQPLAAGKRHGGNHGEGREGRHARVHRGERGARRDE